MLLGYSCRLLMYNGELSTKKHMAFSHQSVPEESIKTIKEKKKGISLEELHKGCFQLF